MSMNVTQGSRTGGISNNNSGSRRTGNTTSGSRNESIFNAPRPGSGSAPSGANRSGGANPFDGKSFNKYAYDHHFGEVNGKDYGHRGGPKRHHGFNDSKFEHHLYREQNPKGILPNIGKGISDGAKIGNSIIPVVGGIVGGVVGGVVGFFKGLFG